MKKAISILYKIYYTIGVVLIGLMSALVMLSVITRYFFGFTTTWGEELITSIFIFSVFWGIGVLTVEDEHVVFDFFCCKLKGISRVAVKVISYLIILAIEIIVLKDSISWVKMGATQISVGMRVTMNYLYMVVPISLVIAIICGLYKLWEAITVNPGCNIDKIKASEM